MAYQICTCGKPVLKSLLRHGLVAFYDPQGNEIKYCPHCGEELKSAQK